MPEDIVMGHPPEGGEPNGGLDPNSTANVPTGDGTPESGTAPDYEGSPPEPKPEELSVKVERLTKQLSDRDSHISKQSEEIINLGNTVSEMKGKVDFLSKPQDTEEARLTRENEILDDIPKAMNNLRTEFKDLLKLTVDNKTTEFNERLFKQREYDKAWKGFYDSNSYLKAHADDIVPAVYARLKPSLKGLTDAQAFEKIKEASNKEILRMQRKFGGGNANANQSTMPTRGGATSFSGEGLPPDSKAMSLAELGDEIFDAQEEIVNRSRGRSSVSK